MKIPIDDTIARAHIFTTRHRTLRGASRSVLTGETAFSVAGGCFNACTPNGHFEVVGVVPEGNHAQFQRTLSRVRPARLLKNWAGW